MSNKIKLLIGLTVTAILYLSFAFFTYSDYGVTSDEPLEYAAGRLLLDYYRTGDYNNEEEIAQRHLPTDSTYFRGHLALQTLLNKEGSYERFHLLNMLFALPVFLIFYVLLFVEYKNFYLAFLGPVGLALTPRFFGDIPANPKDVPFAVLYAISVALIYIFHKLEIRNPKFRSWVKILVLGVIFGLTQTTRLIGASVFLIYVVFGLLEMRPLDKDKLVGFVKELVLMGAVALVVMTVSIPLLTAEFPGGYKNVIEDSINYNYWKNRMLYMGEFLTREERPVSYLPVWFLITTPLFVLVPFLLSPFIVKFSAGIRKIYLLLMSAVFINMLAYFIFDPVIYNGLRHFLYLVPLLTLIAVFTIIEGINFAYMKKRINAFVLSLVVIAGMFAVVKDYVLLHPYEYVYFNELVGGLPGASGRFDSDYWGASYKEASEYVRNELARDGSVDVYVCDMGAVVRYYARGSFATTKYEDAEYMMCDFDSGLEREIEGETVYTVSRKGTPLNTVRLINR